MFFLIAVVLLNVLLSSIFKLFSRFGIEPLQAIVTNYYVCVITGSIYLGAFPYSAQCLHTAWFLWTPIMGAGFISIFYLLAWCTRVDGITVAAIANKLSLVTPVIFSLIWMHETAGILKIGGIVLAFPAIYLTTRSADDSGAAKNLWLPGLIFIGGGLLDTGMNYIQHNLFITSSDPDHYTIYCFSVAGAIGTLVLGWQVLSGRTTLKTKNFVAGICLGIPNYFSIYFFVRMLHSSFLESSASIPVVNIGIVVASALAAVMFYHEKMNLARLAGLVLSVLSIILIALGKA